MKKIVLITLWLSLIACLTAIEISVEIDPYGWQKDRSTNNSSIMIEPGSPMLPYIPVSVLIPFGEKVESVSVSLSEQVNAGNRASFPVAQHQLPISPRTQEDAKTPALPELQNRFYPDRDYDYLGTQYYRGYQIAIFNLYPYHYNPISREIMVSSNALISIQSSFSSTEAEYQAAFVTRNTDTINTLGKMLANPDVIAGYRESASYRSISPSTRLIDFSTPRQMIIVTNAERENWFTEYAQWRSSMGVSTGIFTMEDILSSYTGSDSAAKLRNFIAHAYQTWSDSESPLEYVILGGDDEIVPERGTFGRVGDTVDNRMPTDLYYGALDGTWNANNNNLYGEVSDNVDLIPEVHVGRFPAETLSEFQNIFRKSKYYVEANTFSNNLALFIGENLNMNPVTWGGDYKDDVAQYLPDEYNLYTLYQREGTYNAGAVWNAINNGAGVMNHMGHANETSLIGQSSTGVNNLQNSEYGFLYSQGCYPAAFDQRTSGDGESVGEHFVTASGALFAFIGNTRYGWYMPGSIEGASQFYDRQFFNGLFDQDLPELGKALSFSRTQNLNAAMSNDVMRWCYYEMVLFGDPSIAVKPADANMPMLSLNSYSFSDEDGDNDGTINPGEIIRFHPVVRNSTGWGTANDVMVRIVSVPPGVEALGPCVSIAQLAPGALSDANLFSRIQLPETLGFGIYNIKVEIESLHPITSLSTGIRTFTVEIQLTLEDNRFPWESSTGSKSAPVVGNFDDQPGLDILYLDALGNASVIGNDGELSQSFSSELDLLINRSYSVGNIDGIGADDIVIASRTGDIYAMNIDGDMLFSGYRPDTSFLITPVLADINGNGNLEIVCGGMDGKLYALSSTGALLQGFPVSLGGLFQSEIAAADMNGDGNLDIIAGTSSGNLFVVNSSGTILPGFPVNLGSSITGSPTITHDNRIICSTSTQIYIVSPTGEIISTRSTDSAIAGGFAIGDITGDGIGIDAAGVSLSGTVYAFSSNGVDLPGFPVSTGVSFSCPPLLANLDDNPQLEIILHSYDNTLYIYNSDSSLKQGYPFVSTLNGSNPGTLIDFDENGVAKLVLGFSNGVVVYNLRASSSQLAPWTTYRGGLLRQGSFASTGSVSTSDSYASPVSTELFQNYPNPFNPETTIRYSIAKAAPVGLDIYNVKGQKVRSLPQGNKQAGTFSVVWDGKDDTGRGVASGVYLYRLSIDNRILQKRMLLLK